MTYSTTADPTTDRAPDAAEGVGIDLASRAVGGSVVWANDELFAHKENLVAAHDPSYAARTFNPKGQEYDGWETRRRRPSRERDDAAAAGGTGEEPHDTAVVRLGLPGVISAVTVDTSHFVGNFPPRCSVDACRFDGYPGPEELATARWVRIVVPTPLRGDSATNTFASAVTDRRFTHVRLNIYPDGGVARLRVHGTPVLDPAFLADLTVDLAAISNGGQVAACSDMFFGHVSNLIAPGLARTMGEGWETARRRTPGNDWVELRLAGQGVVRVVEIDTTHFIGNAPDQIRLRGASFDENAARRTIDDPAAGWFELLPVARLQPDTSHRFLVTGSRPVTHLRLDVLPDGGIARLRAFGTLTATGLAAVTERWQAASGERPATAATPDGG